MNLKNLLLLMLAGIVFIGVVLTAGCTITRIAKDIIPQEAFTLIQNNQNKPDFAILDVRTPEEFTDGHIENAINIDFYSETFRDELDNLDKNKTYLIYCHSGSRSGKALNIMKGLNFKEVYNVSGGIMAWNAEGLPTTK
ncbi:rhodanese-like domain-containing protein [Chloroflexota bacterium]